VFGFEVFLKSFFRTEKQRTAIVGSGNDDFSVSCHQTDGGVAAEPLTKQDGVIVFIFTGVDLFLDDFFQEITMIMGVLLGKFHI
jgi:hypothetical protein